MSKKDWPPSPWRRTFAPRVPWADVAGMGVRRGRRGGVIWGLTCGAGDA